MLKCNTEIMKDLKKIEEEKYLILEKEREQSIIRYVSKEDKIIPAYNYAETRAKLDELYKREIYLKGLLQKANASVVVPEFDMTIGDCLVYLAQLAEKAKTLRMLSCKEPKTRTLQYQKQVEFSEALYDIAKAKEDYEATQALIVKLQMALDRVNLTNLIEV